MSAQRMVTLWSVETGQRIERWPVDARGMVACGEYVTDRALVPSGTTPEPDPKPTDDTPTFTGGFVVENAGGGWYKAFGPDGEQVGKSQRSFEGAAAMIPAVHHVGAAKGEPAEHSPGVPLNPDRG